MCDILVALGDATASNRVIFGKNSDRPAGECQVLFDSATESPSRDSIIQAAFVEVPDVPDVLRTIGTRPYWCWGYETGINEAGVVGGNTAVYTRSFWRMDNQAILGLTGMELLRLGLERGSTAQGAIDVITVLLEAYGQWGPAVIGADPPQSCYENAFLIADANEAWVLETAGRRWVAKQIVSGVRALSNELSIRSKWTVGSPGIVEDAVTNKWWSLEDGPLDFARAYSDHEHYSRQASHIRWSRATQLLRDAHGGITPAMMIEFLRDHYEGTFIQGPQFDVYTPDFLTICMHDSPSGFTWGNTATSFVVEIDPNNPLATPFWCCYQPPCSSVYLPFTMETTLPPAVASPGTAGFLSESPATAPKDSFSDESLWWRLYRVLDAVKANPIKRREELRSYFDLVELSGHHWVETLPALGATERASKTAAQIESQMLEVDEILARLETNWNISR